jgi:hypothetical protein
VIITVSLIHTLYTSLDHTAYCVSTRLLVTASDGGRSPSSGFPNCPRPQLPASNSNSSQWLYCNHPQLTISAIHQPTPLTSLTVLLITSWHRQHRKHRSSVAVYRLLPSSNSHCLAVAWHIPSCVHSDWHGTRRKHHSSLLLFTGHHLATIVVHLLISRLLPSNRSTCHIAPFLLFKRLYLWRLWSVSPSFPVARFSRLLLFNCSPP